MALTVVTTPGAANANSYASVAEVDTYAETHPYASGWTVAGTEKKKQLVIWTTRMLDSMPGAWKGEAATAVQSLGFPRRGLLTKNKFPLSATVVPGELKTAQAEWCRQLANETEDGTATDDIMKQGIKSVGAGPVSLSFMDSLTQQQIAQPSNRALARVVPDAVKMLIPPHWLIPVKDQQAEERLGLLLRSL